MTAHYGWCSEIEYLPFGSGTAEEKTSTRSVSIAIFLFFVCREFEGAFVPVINNYTLHINTSFRGLHVQCPGCVTPARLPVAPPDYDEHPRITQSDEVTRLKKPHITFAAHRVWSLEGGEAAEGSGGERWRWLLSASVNKQKMWRSKEEKSQEWRFLFFCKKRRRQTAANRHFLIGWISKFGVFFFFYKWRQKGNTLL